MDVAGVLAAACSAVTVCFSPPQGAAVRLQPVVAGLDAPVHVAAPRSEPRRLYVVERAGRIRVLVDGVLRPRPFLDIERLVASGGERGLLSVAFHPRYARNRRFYVDYTDLNGDTRVVEYRLDRRRGPVRRRQLLFVRQPYTNHNGGQLAFGPDGRLYVGMGDGGSGGDPQNRAQDPRTLLGKLVRINVDARRPRPEIAAFGLRNPWRFSFDRANGDLYLADVGQARWEEINYVPRRSPGLENFGWDVYEGNDVYERKQPGPGRLVSPIATYCRADGCSVTGGFVYRGRAMAAFRGRYVYGDYCSGKMWSLRVAGGRAVDVRLEEIRLPRLSSFGEDARGELYAVSLNGSLYRIAG